MGAAGKDFHVFNCVYKDRPEYDVVAFTATQISGIDGRSYPARLAGELYPEGVPIEPEEDLVGLIREHRVDEVIFAYSDVSYEYIVEREEIVKEANAEFHLAPVSQIMIPSTKQVVAVTAVRTGCGKSAVTRRVVKLLREKGRRVAVVRHPMPYGDLQRQELQKFETMDDLDRHQCTIEEREEYEPHLRNGTMVFAGVDYCRIIQEAELEADALVWDGGNNDVPFFRPDIHICVADPLRAGHETEYYPGRINFETADVILINKIDSATPEQIALIEENAKKMNPEARVIKSRMPYSVDKPELIQDKRCLVIEDGPSLTHGEMKFGAGVLAAKKYGASQVVDPRPYVSGEMADVFEKYPEIGQLLPAMGYSPQQIKDLENTINAADCDTVVVATPIDLSAVLNIKKPLVRVTYEIEEENDDLRKIMQDF